MGNDFTEVEVGSRYEKTRLLICGEASGAAEAQEQLPFRPHAQAGSLLADCMREVNISRADVAITNVLRCRPKNDWLEGAPYSHDAIYNCVKNSLFDVVDRLKPRAILAVGGVATRVLTTVPRGKYGGLDYVRGYVHAGSGPAVGIPVIPTYHSAFIRRGAAHLIPLLQRDLLRAFQLAEGKLIEDRHFALDPQRLGLRYQTLPSVDEAWRWTKEIDSDLPLSLDLETPKSTREDEDERVSFADRDILMFQATQRRGEGVALPWRDQFIEIAHEILRKKVAARFGHNWWNFDQEVLGTNGVSLEDNFDDTMVMWSYYWSDLPANLQAAAQGCGFPFSWKHLGDVDREFYGVADVDAGLCVYQFMRAKLEREGFWSSYRRYFAEVKPILHDMARRGIPISNVRRQELKALIEREAVRVVAATQPLVPEAVLSSKQAKGGYKNPPKLKCEDCGWAGREDHVCADGETVPYTQLAEDEGLVQREIVIKEGEKCRCKKSERAECHACAGTGTIPAGTVEQWWTYLKEFNPNSWKQVRRLIKALGHPVPKHAKRVDAQGEASDTTEMKELERLAQRTKHPIYPLLIEKRMLTKVEGTYVEGWRPSNDGAVHTTYTFQTATWQTSSRSPNVQNGLKHGKTEFQKQLASSFNGMQCAASGRVLVNFDFKSFHALTTAHDFNIPDYARLARIDIHSFVTCWFLKHPQREKLWAMSDADMLALFKELKRDDHFKFVRDFKAKRAILGIQFGMGYRKLYQLNRDDFESESEARLVWEMVYHLFPRLRTAQDDVRRRAAEDKRLVNQFGAIRHFFDVTRWSRKEQRWIPGDQAEQAVAFLPASHAFGVVRDTLLRIRAQGWDARFGLCNQIHDSLLFHCPLALIDECLALVKPEMERPSTILRYPAMAPEGFQVGADALVGESMADLK